MRITDLFLALPGPILAIAVVAALGPSLQHTLIAVMIVWWPFYARIVRGEIRALRRPAPRRGGPPRRRRADPLGPCATCCPGAVPATWSRPASTSATSCSPWPACRSSASARRRRRPSSAPWPPAGLPYLLEQWWVPVMPGLAVFLLALVANLAGDGLRDLIGRPLMARVHRSSGSPSMVVILLVLAGVVFMLQQVTPDRPGPRHARGQRVAGDDRGREATSSATTSRCRSSTSTTSAASSTATCRCRCAPGARSPPTSAPTCRPRSSWRSYGVVLAAVLGVALGLADRGRGSRARACCAVVLVGCASAPAFLLALLGHPALLPAARLAAGDRPHRRSTTRPTGRPGCSPSTRSLHGRLDVFGDALQHLILPGVLRGHPARPCRSGGCCARASSPRCDRLRAHGPGQGLRERGRAVAPRAAQLARARRCR